MGFSGDQDNMDMPLRGEMISKRIMDKKDPKAKKKSEPSPRTPLKRQRIKVTKFQSPASEEAKPKSKLPVEEKRTEYKKNSFLALRNDEGGFYLCKTAQNVFNTSKSFKINWLSLEQSPNIYKMDFFDQTEMDCVVTNVHMEKITKDSFRLPHGEQTRVEHIVENAIKKEQGIPIDENEGEETDWQDVDDDEEEPVRKKARIQKSDEPTGKVKPVFRVNLKSNKQKMKQKAKQSNTAENKKKGKGKSQSKLKEKKQKVKGPDRNLKPQPNVKIIEKDPFFESKTPVPFISKRAHCKLAIRAVLLNDMALLKSLLKDDEHVHKLDVNRSVDVKMNALQFAIQKHNVEAIKILTDDFFNEKNPRILKNTDFEPLINTTDTGTYNPVSLGVAYVRPVAMSRGNKEGNDAFTKDNQNFETSMTEYLEYALNAGVNSEIMEILMASKPNSSRDDQIRRLYSSIHCAVIRGHRQLASKLVEEAFTVGGFGFNNLHKEVLKFDKEDLRHFLAVSVKKKALDNRGVGELMQDPSAIKSLDHILSSIAQLVRLSGMITPLHCAAINPNAKYLSALIAIEPDINLPDRSQRRPIHYAAACSGPAPLQLLLDRGASPYEVDSQGMIPLHFACQAGRATNVDVLLKKANTSQQKESSVITNKYGVGGVNRPNRISFCPLHFAVSENSVDCVKNLVKYGADVNKVLSASKQKMSPLMLAASLGYLDIIRILVQNGATIELQDKRKRTALTHAVLNGHTHVASYLLYLGSNPDHADSSGNTCVHYAAAYGWYFPLKLLVDDAGATTKSSNDWKVTPVGIAFLKGHIGLVDYLLEQPEADINFKDDTGMTLVSIACTSPLVPGLLEQMLYLVEDKKADVTVTDIRGFNPLHHLAVNIQSGDSEEGRMPRARARGQHTQAGKLSEDAMDLAVKLAELLIIHGCDPTAKTKQGQTPIMLAIEKVNPRVVKCLIDHGGSVSANKNSDGRTVLHLMAQQCMETDMASLLKILLEQNSAPKKVNKDSKTNSRDLEMDENTEQKVNGLDKMDDSTDSVKESPADDNVLRQMASAVDNKGYTPLLQACQSYRTFKKQSSGHVKVSDIEAMWEQGRMFIRQLIESVWSDINGTVQKKYFSGLPPSKEADQYTAEGKWAPVHFMITARNEQPSGAVISPCPGLDMLLLYRPILDQTTVAGKTPLAVAIETNSPAAVKRLLAAGANPNQTYMKDEKTVMYPIIAAASGGHIDSLEQLVKAKANVDVREATDDKTALHLIVKYRKNESQALAMAKILLDYGADIEATDKKKRTALHLAVNNNSGSSDTSTDLEEFLLDKGANTFAKDCRGRVPLHYAFVKIHGHTDKSALDPIELCSTLTSAMDGQYLDDPDEFGQTPLHRAALRGAAICCMHLLQRKCNISRKDVIGNSPLALAVNNRHDSCAIMLIQKGAEVKDVIVSPAPQEKKSANQDKKQKPEWKWKPLQSAEKPQAIHCSVFQEAIHAELQGVAHMILDSADMDVLSAIEAAICVTKYNVVLRLMRNVRDVTKLQATNKDGQNLLHVLCLKSKPHKDTDLQLKVARMLIDKGVSLSGTDRFGSTPIMYAALTHQTAKLPHLFLETDAFLDIRKKNNFERDVVTAFFWNYSPMEDDGLDMRAWIELLLSRGGSLDVLYDKPLPDSMLYGDPSCPVKVIDFFKKYNVTRVSPLIFALYCWDLKLVKFLMKQGASINFMDEKGITPLMHAVNVNDLHTVKLLLNRDYLPPDKSKDDGGTKKNDDKRSRREFMGSYKLPRKRLARKVPRITLATGPRSPSDASNDDDQPEEESEHDESIMDGDEDENGSADDAEEEPMDEDDNGDDVDENELGDDEDDDAIEDEEEEEEDFDDEDHDTDEAEDDDDKLAVALRENLKKGMLPSVMTKSTSLTKQPSNALILTDEYDTVEKTSNVDLMVRDYQGWTVVHHLVCPLDYGTYDNVELLYVLAKAGAPLQLKDNAGLSPLDHALIRGASDVATMLQKLCGLEQARWEKPTYISQVYADPALKDAAIDIEGDSDSMLKIMDEAVMKTDSASESPKMLPDDACSFKDTSEVIIDETLNIPFDILLSKIDVSHGLWGVYNFYKMQLLKQQGKAVFVLFTKWGRIGDEGQHQQTPFQSRAEGVKEFCKVFKSKTGNAWNNIKSFTDHPKKYRLIPFESRQKGVKEHRVEFDLESPKPTSLPPFLQDVITEMSNVKMLGAAVNRVGIDTEHMALGRINKESLLKAREILLEIRSLLKVINEQRESALTINLDDYWTNSTKVSNLSTKFYQLIPHFGYTYEKIAPVDDQDEVKKHLLSVTNLLDYDIASKILLGAQFRKKEMNPLDYIYRAMGCSIEQLCEDDVQSQYILKYINNTCPKSKVEGIFRLSRPNEESKMRSLGLDNHYLLWHGSGVANFISILRRGLVACPPEALISGHMFGEGVYTADAFCKSVAYCHNYSKDSKTKFMLLSEVALGNAKISKNDEEQIEPIDIDSEFNSLIAVGKKAPDRTLELALPFGARLPLGPLRSSGKSKGWSYDLNYNEFIVYNSDQICLRYLVQFQ